MHRDVGKRIMAVLLSICMIAGMVDWSGFTARAADENGGIMVGATITRSFEYTGSQIRPSVTDVTVRVEDDAQGRTELPQDEQYYTLEYETNINVGFGYVTVKGQGDYAGQDLPRVPFTITKKDLSSFAVVYNNEQFVTQNGPVEPSVDVKDPVRGSLQGVEAKNYNASSNADYTYEYSDNGVDDNTTTKTATITIKGVNNYAGAITKTFTITKMKSDLLTIEINDSAYTRLGGQVNAGDRYLNYNGNNKFLDKDQGDVTVKYNSTTVLKPEEYDIEYSSQNLHSAGVVKVFAKGRGDRYGNLRTTEDNAAELKIKKRISSNSYNTTPEKKVQISIDDHDYPGSGQTLTIDPEKVHFSDPDGRADDTTEKFTIDNDSVTQVGSMENGRVKYQVRITGTGNYHGYRDVEFTVRADQLTSSNVTISAENRAKIRYDGTTNWFDEVKQYIQVEGRNGTCTENVEYRLAQVETGEAKNAGKYHILVSPVPGSLFDGSAPYRLEFEVQKYDVRNCSVVITDGPFTYDGLPKRPQPTVTYTDGTGNPSDSMTYNTDYTLSWSNDVNAGQATVTVTGRDRNFTGSKSVNYTINPVVMNDAEGGNTVVSNLKDSYTFTGSAITPHDVNFSPTMEIRVNGTRIYSPGDYVVEYTPNVNIGTVTMTISGAENGNYTGSFTRTFEITPQAIKGGVKASYKSPQTYTGEQIRPDITLTHGVTGVTLVNPTDYTVDYGENLNVGTGTITVTGQGNYEGEETYTFTITQCNIGSLSDLGIKANGKSGASETYDFITMPKDETFYKYTGSPIELENGYNLSLTHGKNPMYIGEDRDYTVSYQKNTEIGEATLIISGKGNYSGTKRVPFLIKGDLSDWNQVGGFTEIKIPPQIYSAIAIVPKNVEINFGKEGNKKPLTEKDFDVANAYPDTATPVGDDAGSATITGKGDYFNSTTITVPFDVIPLNLTEEEENLKDIHQYLINNVEETYTYTSLAIKPEPVITHNGQLINEYDLSYYDYTVNAQTGEETGAPVDVGKYAVRITGQQPNYEGYTEQPYKIASYDIGKGEESGKITLANTDESVILDAVKYQEDYDGPAMMELDEDGNPTDRIIWKNLEVKYIPVEFDGTEHPEVTLEPGVDYTIEYKENELPGTATYTIEGIGNFSGKIEKTFKILADLEGEHIHVTAGDCTFTPADANKVATNHPETLEVEYDVLMADGSTRPVVLEDTDYTVTYKNNGAATKAPVGREEESEITVDENNLPTVIVTATADGKATGVNETETFDIYQRNLENEEDELLEITGLLEDGYEYTGSPIIPDIRISCNSRPLAREPEPDYDYSIEAVRNTNVWEFDESGQRGKAIATVFAKKNTDGKYTGNYFGKFEREFKINPREISEATIDTITKIENTRVGKGDLVTINAKGEWETNYTRKKVNFPLTGPSTDPDPEENALVINWNKGKGDTLLEENKDYHITYKDNTKIGEATVHIEAPEMSNYAGSYDKHFKIMASIEEVDNPNPESPGRYMNLSYNRDVYYGKVDVFPDLRFEDMSGVYSGELDEPYILEEGTLGDEKDFIIVTKDNYKQLGADSYSENNRTITGETEATVVIMGTRYYRGTITKTYRIIPKDFADMESGITVKFLGSRNDGDYKDAYVYNGQEQKPSIEIYNNNIKNLDKEGYDKYQTVLKLEPDEYKITGWNYNKDISEDIGRPAEVTIEGIGPNYTGKGTFYFTIIRRPMEDVRYQIKDTCTYNGMRQEPAVTVYYMEGGKNITLTEDTDYEIEYINNIDAKAENAEENPPTILLTGIGGYGGKREIPFTISPKNINSEDITATGSALYANGGPVEARVAVTDNGVPADCATLVKDKDFTLSNQSIQTGIGEQGTVTVTGTGNYTGTRTATFRILPPDGTFQIEPIEAQEYNTKPIRPKVKVNLLVQDSDMSVELTEGLDYDVAYDNCQNAGVATVTVTGKDNFLNKRVTASYAINPKSIGADGVIDASMTMGDIKEYQFTGTAIVPAVDLRFQLPAAEGAATPGEAVPLVVGRDYQVTCVNNTSIGVATATITGINNYSGTITRDFRILGNMNMATVAPIPTQQYTGSAVTPEPMVSMGGVALVKGVHYTVEYRNNVERGTASIILTGIGEWLSGTKTVTFDIARELSDSTVIRGVAAAYTYTGAAIAPPVRVEEEGSLLVNGVDYQVIYEQNVNAGTATITIMGINKYSGSRTVTFRITPQQLGRATVAPVEEQIYDGQEKNPPVTVTSGTTTLENGRDYNLVYVNSATPGMASIIIKGEGNYTGTQTVNYNIAVPEITGVKTSKYTNKSITLSWTKNSAVSGYEIYNSKNRRDVRITKPGTTKGTISKLKAGTGATFRVRAYVNKDGQYYYGPFTSIKTATAPDSTKISSIASNKAKQVTVKWKKVKGATQYEVYRSTKSKSGYKKIGTTKKTSYTDKKATGGKKYYYKIRVCKKIDKKNYYSSYSAVKSVTAKK